MRMQALAAALVLALCTSILFAPDKKESSSPSQQPAQDEAMALMMKLGTPGAEHEKLKAMEGTFDAELTCQMMPDAPTMSSRGKMTNKMILGGRFLQGHYKGAFMGMPFTGQSLLGYDNAKKEYVSTWIDSMSTTIWTSSGPGDSSGKVITCTSTVDCPIEKRPKTMKSITTIIDNNAHTFETYEIGADGKERKTMTIKYTRADNGRTGG